MAQFALKVTHLAVSLISIVQLFQFSFYQPPSYFKLTPTTAINHSQFTFQKRTLRLLVHPDALQKDRHPLLNSRPGVHHHRSQKRRSHWQAARRIQQENIRDERQQTNAGDDVNVNQETVLEEVWGETCGGDICRQVEEAEWVETWGPGRCQ